MLVITLQLYNLDKFSYENHKNRIVLSIYRNVPPEPRNYNILKYETILQVVNNNIIITFTIYLRINLQVIKFIKNIWLSTDYNLNCWV